MPQDHKIPHTQPWPDVTRAEQKLLQPLVDLVNGDEPTGERKRVLESRLATPGHPGSANQAALKVSMCLVAEPDNPAWQEDCQEYFRTQERNGFMAPWGRDEFGDEGGHGQFHVAATAAILMTNRMSERAFKWLRGWAALHELTLYNKSCYMPGWRSGMTKSPHSPLTLSLLQTAKWVPGAKEWRWTTKAGYPQAIGAWFLRHLYELDVLKGPLQFGNADLPTISHPIHVVRTTAGICNWLVGCQAVPSGLACQPVAGAWGKREFFYRRDVGKPYNGPAWPTETSPGFPLEGDVISHWRGDINGWKRLK